MVELKLKRHVLHCTSSIELSIEVDSSILFEHLKVYSNFTEIAWLSDGKNFELESI